MTKKTRCYFCDIAIAYRIKLGNFVLFKNQ